VIQNKQFPGMKAMKAMNIRIIRILIRIKKSRGIINLEAHYKFINNFNIEDESDIQYYN